MALQPKQQELWRLWNESDVTRIGFGGARGGAKSGGGRRCMLLRRLQYPRTPGLILRRTYPDLYKSHLVKLFEEFPGIQEYWRDQPKELRLPNGSRLFFGSAEHAGDLAAFHSAEFADIMPDESQEFAQGELEDLTGSNRCTSNPNIQPKMIYTFMPGVSESGLPPKGLSYLKRVFVDKLLQGQELKKKWAFIQSFSWDNIEWARKELGWEKDDRGRWVLGPGGVSEEEFYSWSNDERREYFIEHTDYGETLNSLTNQAKRDAWLYGKWDVFQGQYFPNFSHEKHVITREEAAERMKPWHKRWLSGDWGFDHPSVVYWHCEDEYGRIITYREQWGREMGETELGKLVTRMSEGERLVSFPFSWDAGKQSKRSMRAAPKSIVELLNISLGPKLPKAFPADSSPGTRMAGWRLMYQLLDADMWQIVGEDCPKLIECIPSLIRNPDNTEDVLKVNFVENQIGDDPADAARMGLQFMKKPGVKPYGIIRQEVIAAAAQNATPGNIGQSRFIADVHLKNQQDQQRKQVQTRRTSTRLRRRG